MIVVDASVAVLGLLNDGEAREVLATEAVAAPHLVDSEVVQSLRSQVLRGHVDSDAATALIGTWMRLGLRRFSAVDLLPRVWELRANLTSYDATYVALAEALGSAMVTADARMANAPGPTCPITVIRR